jgi:hypothetical protein
MDQRAPYRCSRHKKPNHDHPECLVEREAASKSEPVVTVEIEPRVGASIPILAQASKIAPRRGRGAGRRFTKTTAAGAAVARAQHLTPEQRQDIARRAASTRWGSRTKEAR